MESRKTKQKIAQEVECQEKIEEQRTVLNEDEYVKLLNTSEQRRYENFKKLMCAPGGLKEKDVQSIYDYMSQNEGQVTTEYLRSKGYDVSKQSADLWGLIYNISIATDNPLEYDLKVQQEKSAQTIQVLTLTAAQLYEAYSRPKAIEEPGFKGFNFEKSEGVGNTELDELRSKGETYPKHSVQTDGKALPGKGEANSSKDLLNPDGSVKQRRYYGPDGKALEDIDFNHTDDGTHTFPHRHKWDWSKIPPRQDSR